VTIRSSGVRTSTTTGAAAGGAGLRLQPVTIPIPSNARHKKDNRRWRMAILGKR
jgi:hypothetical protein